MLAPGHSEDMDDNCVMHRSLGLYVNNAYSIHVTSGVICSEKSYIQLIAPVITPHPTIES